MRYNTNNYSEKLKTHTRLLTEIENLISTLEKADLDNELITVKERLEKSRSLIKFKVDNLSNISHIRLKDVGILEVDKITKDRVDFTNKMSLVFIPEESGSASIDFRNLIGTRFEKELITKLEAVFLEKGVKVNGVFIKGFDHARAVLRPECHLMLLDKNGKLIDTLLTLKKNEVLTFDYRQDRIAELGE